MGPLDGRPGQCNVGHKNAKTTPLVTPPQENPKTEIFFFDSELLDFQTFWIRRGFLNTSLALVAGKLQPNNVEPIYWLDYRKAPIAKLQSSSMVQVAFVWCFFENIFSKRCRCWSVRDCRHYLSSIRMWMDGLRTEDGQRVYDRGSQPGVHAPPGVFLRLSIEEQNIFAYILFQNIYTCQWIFKNNSMLIVKYIYE